MSGPEPDDRTGDAKELRNLELIFIQEKSAGLPYLCNNAPVWDLTHIISWCAR